MGRTNEVVTNARDYNKQSLTRENLNRTAALLLVGLAAAACRPSRTVKIAWDPPATPPAGYRILIDDRVVLEIAPPPLDPSCSCPTVAVQVPKGEHTLKVVAFNRYGESEPSAITVVK